MLNNSIGILKSGTDPAQITQNMHSLLRSPEFIEYVHNQISDPVLLTYFPKFSLTVVHDDDFREGGPSEAVMQISKFKFIIDTYEDVLAQFIHDTLHEVAHTLWQRCPVQLNSLTERELDVFNDIWIQAYVATREPKLGYLHPIYVRKYITAVGGDPATVEDVIALFDVPPPAIVTTPLPLIHQWIHTRSDVYTQQTFSFFMKQCERSLSSPSTTSMIARYKISMESSV